jgi:uncharacterized repeat protein (TIGR01451 family)
LAVQVNAILPSNTTIHNIARITSAETAAYGWLSSNQVEVETVDLWVEKHVYPPVAQANDWVSYTISYGNHGSADALGVQIRDTLSPSITYRAGSIWGTGADDSKEPTLVWDVATLTAGASAQEVGYVAVLDSGLVPGSIITNTAILSSASGLETSDTVMVVVTGPHISVSPVALTATLDEGGTTMRTLIIGNEGVADLIWNLAEEPAVSWLGVAPMSGATPPLDSDEVTVTFDATGLTGVYTTMLQISSNDPDEPQVSVPVTLTALVPDVTVSPAVLTATLDAGDTTTRTLIIGNVGEAVLTWSLVESPATSWSDQAPTSGALAPLGSDEVTVSFDATGMAGVYTTTLQINSNDPDEPQVNVPVILNVLPQNGGIKVSPRALTATLNVGDTATQTLTISNLGAGDLTWSLTENEPVSWLHETSTGGTLASQDSYDVAVIFDAAGLMTGTYTTTLRVNSNDLDRPSVNVLVTLYVVQHHVYLPVVAFYRPPSLSLTKSADLEGVYAGSRLNYSLQVDNSGGLARNLVVSDVLPARTTFSGCDCQIESGACDASFTCGLEGDRVVWSVGELAADSALEMILWVTVDASLSDGELIVNDDYAAVADGVGLQSGPPVTTPVHQFHVSVSKTAWPNPVMVGQELTYTIRVTKSGSFLKDVQVTDLLPSGVSYVEDNCEGGWDCTFVEDNEAKSEVGDVVYSWHISGEPLEVRVLDPAHYVYLPLVLSGSSPQSWLGHSFGFRLDKAQTAEVCTRPSSHKPRHVLPPVRACTDQGLSSEFFHELRSWHYSAGRKAFTQTASSR